MGLLRLAATILFILAALAGLGWAISWQLDTIVGVIAAGLGCWCASTLPIPQPPSAR